MSTTEDLVNQHAADILDAGSDDDDDQLPTLDTSSIKSASSLTAASTGATSTKKPASADTEAKQVMKGRAARSPSVKARDKKQQESRINTTQRQRARAGARRHRVTDASNKPLAKTILTHGLNALMHRAGIVRKEKDVPTTFRCIALALTGELLQGAHVLTRFTDRKQVRNKDIAAACRYKLNGRVVV